jgi:hypothetical protein
MGDNPSIGHKRLDYIPSFVRNLSKYDANKRVVLPDEINFVHRLSR